MDERIVSLYRQPPEDFVSGRDALVKALKAEGDKEAAAAVKALRRPTVVAWALNEVATSSPEVVAALVDAGEALARAQDEVLGGGGGDALREAMRGRREATKRVSDAAAAVLESAGRNASNQAAAVAAVIEAVATDAELAARLRGGVLSGDAPEPAGDLFGSTPPRSAKAPKPDRKLSRARDAVTAAQSAVDDAEAARREAAEAAEVAERHVAEIRVELAAAEKSAKAAAAALDKAERAAANVSAALASAEEELRAQEK